MEKVDQHATGQSNKTQDGEVDVVEFQKEHPYIMGLTFYKYGFENQTK